MKKKSTLWMITKYSLILVFLHTFVDLISGEIELSEVPSYVLSFIIHIVVVIVICCILLYIVALVVRLFRL